MRERVVALSPALRIGGLGDAPMASEEHFLL